MLQGCFHNNLLRIVCSECSFSQSIVMYQLTPEEAERYRDIPVLLDFGVTGFYCFPVRVFRAAMTMLS